MDLNITADEIAAELSVPSSSRFEEAANAAATQIARVLFDAVATRANSSEDSLVALLRALFADSATTATQFNCVWTPAVADCLTLLKSEDPWADCEPVFVKILANAIAYGFTGCGTVCLKAPCAIVWRKRLLPAVRRLQFECSGRDRMVTVTREEFPEKPYHLVIRGDGEWYSPDGRDIEFPSLEGTEIALLDSSHVDGLPGLNLGFSLVESVCASDLKQVHAALDLLERLNPLYPRWVTKVLRYLQVIESPDGRLNSGSSRWSWGNVAISRLGEEIKSICSTCEMLIHECSHQYFHLVQSLGKLTLDEGEYYSPFPRAMRPLEPILLGAHAFVNVLAFYREALAVHPELERWLAGQKRAIVQDVEQVRPLLEDGKKFTALGHSFLLPLLLKLDDVTARDKNC